MITTVRRPRITPAPRYEIGDLVFTWPTEAQVEAYYHAIVGTNLFDTLLWNGPESADEIQAYWVSCRAAYALGPEHDITLAVIDRHTDGMIGAGGLRAGLPVHRAWDLGYALVPGWQGRGHGTVLVRLLVDIGFRERGAERLAAEVFVGNHASRRVLEKAGLLFEGTARSAIAKPGGRRDEWRFGMTRGDWVARRT